MKRLFVIMLLVCAAAGAQPASTSKGSMSLNLSIADDNGIDAVTEIITLKNIKASEIEPFIRARLSRYGAVQVNDALNMLIVTDKQPKVRDLAAIVAKLDNAGSASFLRIETEAVPVQFVQPSVIKPYLDKRLSPDGSIDANDDLNLLVITDVRSRINTIKQLIGQLDLMPKQVMVAFRIYDISSTKSAKYGLDMFDIAVKTAPEELHTSISTDRFQYDESFQSSYSYNAHARKHGWTGSFAGSMSPTIIVQALEQATRNGDATLVASPSVLAQNRRNGQLYTDLVFCDRNGYIISRVDGMIVSVTPTITNSDIVGLQISMSFNGATDNNTRLCNSVTTSNCQPLVIGKMNTKIVRYAKNGLPWLKNIPVLGYIFGKKETVEESRNLLIIATPFIFESGQGQAPDTTLIKDDK